MSVRARFVHVGIYFGKEAPLVELETLFSTALDWIRYDTHCWILYTNSELNVWRDHLRRILPTGNQFLLCEFEPILGEKCSGWMKQSVWDWLQKDR